MEEKKREVEKKVCVKNDKSIERVKALSLIDSENTVSRTLSSPPRLNRKPSSSRLSHIQIQGDCVPNTESSSAGLEK